MGTSTEVSGGCRTTVEPVVELLLSGVEVEADPSDGFSPEFIAFALSVLHSAHRHGGQESE